jgi:hypothetical protein
MSESCKCAGCGATLKTAREGAMLIAVVNDPWAADYHLHILECGVCRQAMHLKVSSQQPNKIHSWSAASEMLIPEVDYEVLHRRSGGDLDGTMPIVAMWAWHPMPENERVTGLIVKHITEARLPKSVATVLIMAHDGRADLLEPVFDRFNEVWRLGRHVTSDATGPYPSMRAERSIATSLQGSSMVVVPHFWPSCRIGMAAYQAIMSQKEIYTAWAAYERRHIYGLAAKGMA